MSEIYIYIFGLYWILNNLLIHFFILLIKYARIYIEISSKHRKKKIYIYILHLYKTVMGWDPKSAINRSLFNPICICVRTTFKYFFMHITRNNSKPLEKTVLLLWQKINPKLQIWIVGIVNFFYLWRHLQFQK